MCGVTISRFFRDGRLWEVLGAEVLPSLARAATAAGDKTLSWWSVGCASGEEPYRLSMLWKLGLAHQHPEFALHVLATDVDERVLERAQRAAYSPSTLREVPMDWRVRAFERREGAFWLRDAFCETVTLRRADVRRDLPQETFRLILCRNSVFTYFDEQAQGKTLVQLMARLLDCGALVVGREERVPASAAWPPWSAAFGIYRKGAQADGTGEK